MQQQSKPLRGKEGVVLKCREILAKDNFHWNKCRKHWLGWTGDMEGNSVRD